MDLQQTVFAVNCENTYVTENPYMNKMKRRIEEDKEYVEIANGQHAGKIVELKERKEPFEYVDVIVEVDGYQTSKGKPITLSAGFPDSISPSSKLGCFIQDMGIDVIAGNDVDLEVLIGRKISFTTKQKEYKGKMYANIVRESIIPVKSD